MEENTGVKRSRLKRIRRRGGSESPAEGTSRRNQVVESSEDDLDNDDLELPQVQDIQRIWDDGGRDDEDEDMDDDMDNFIEYGDVGEGQMDEEAREEQRREERRLAKERRKARGAIRGLAGIDAA